MLWLRYPTPELLRLVERHPWRLVVYEVVDDHPGSPGMDDGLRRRFAAAEARVLARAGLVLAWSRPIAERLEAAGAEVRLLEAATDVAAFARVPRAPLERSVRYVGGLDFRLDVPLLRAVATALPDWRFTFAGEVLDDAGRAAAGRAERGARRADRARAGAGVPQPGRGGRGAVRDHRLRRQPLPDQARRVPRGRPARRGDGLRAAGGARRAGARSRATRARSPRRSSPRRPRTATRPRRRGARPSPAGAGRRARRRWRRCSGRRSTVAAERAVLVIPLLDERATVDALLDDCRRLDPAPDEVVAVDAGSTDGTRERLDELARAWPALRVVDAPGAHPGAARDAGIRASDAPLVATVDAGSRIGPGWLGALTAPVAAAPRTFAVGVVEPDARSAFERAAGWSTVRAFKSAAGAGAARRPGAARGPQRLLLPPHELDGGRRLPGGAVVGGQAVRGAAARRRPHAGGRARGGGALAAADVARRALPPVRVLQPRRHARRPGPAQLRADRGRRRGARGAAARAGRAGGPWPPRAPPRISPPTPAARRATGSTGRRSPGCRWCGRRWTAGKVAGCLRGALEVAVGRVAKSP